MMEKKPEYYIAAELAPSNRAMCRGCEEKIAKGTLRIACVFDMDTTENNNQHIVSQKWHHLDCLDRLAKNYQNIEAKDVQGFGNLEKADQTLISDLLQKLNAQPSGRKKQSQKAKAKAKGKGKNKEIESEGDEKIEGGKQSIKEKQKSQTKQKKKGIDSSEEYEQEDVTDDSDADDKKNPQGYTSDEWKKYQQYSKELQSKQMPVLKSLLKLNDQKVAGTKQELVERVADGQTLGAIPKCPKCGGGRPRFNVKSGKYKCPGYMEDTDFIHCNKQFKKDEIERTEWKEL